MTRLHLTSDRNAHAGSGAGSASDPMFVGSAAEFDAVLRKHRKDTTFHLHPGVFETRGAWAFADHDFCTLGDGCSLIGEGGSNRTTLRLAEDCECKVATHRGLVPAQKFEMIIAGSRSGRAEKIRIEGLTIDARGGRHAGGAPLPTVALHVFASRSTLRDLHVLGVDGKWEGANEGFGILVNNCGDASVKPGGHRIEACRVECLSGAYVTGLYCGVTRAKPNAEVDPSTVHDCHVVAPWAIQGKHAHAAFAANTSTTFTSCTGEGFDRFFFCDTGSIDAILLKDCRGFFGYCAVDLPGPVGPGNPILHRQNFQVCDCVFTAVHPHADHVVLLNAQDGSEGSKAFPVHNISIQGCTVTSDTPGVAFYAVSVKAARTSGVRVSGCTLPANRKLGVGPPTPANSVAVVRDAIRPRARLTARARVLLRCPTSLAARVWFNGRPWASQA